MDSPSRPGTAGSSRASRCSTQCPAASTATFCSSNSCTSAATIAAKAWVKLLEQARAAAKERGARGLLHLRDGVGEHRSLLPGAARCSRSPIRSRSSWSRRTSTSSALQDQLAADSSSRRSAILRIIETSSVMMASTLHARTFEPLVVVDPHVDTSATFVFSSRTSSADSIP